MYPLKTRVARDYKQRRHKRPEETAAQHSPEMFLTLFYIQQRQTDEYGSSPTRVRRTFMQSTQRLSCVQDSEWLHI